MEIGNYWEQVVCIIVAITFFVLRRCDTGQNKSVRAKRMFATYPVRFFMNLFMNLIACVEFELHSEPFIHLARPLTISSACESQP
jgi:hypothetical protein